MFEALKKKFMSWVGKDKEKPKKVSVKKTKTPKKEKEDKKIKSSSRVPLTKEEKIQETEAEQIIQEASTSLEQQIPEPAQNKEKDEEKGNFFTKLLKKISTAKLTEGQFDECFEDLEITLLENNVALEAVDAIRTSLKKDLVDQQIKKTEAAARIMGALKEAILSLLTEPPNIVDKIKSHEPYIILFFGINGTGKTTSVAKLAYFLKKQGISVVLAAADTFRAASIEQLKTHSEKIGVPMISSSYGADPASVAFESISYAKKNKTQVVLIDTAGRMYTKDNLLKEMEKIVRISKPNLKLFVGESITGNDAIDQARTFNDTIGIDGVILSKADIDEKAGTILSVSHVTHKPIYFLGTGQKYQDLTLFTKKTVLKNLGLEQ